MKYKSCLSFKFSLASLKYSYNKPLSFRDEISIISDSDWLSQIINENYLPGRKLIDALIFVISDSFQLIEKFSEMAGTSSDQSKVAQKTWEMTNNVETISTVDEIYRYDRKEQQDILAAKPWEKEWVSFVTPFVLCKL